MNVLDDIIYGFKLLYLFLCMCYIFKRISNIKISKNKIIFGLIFPIIIIIRIVLDAINISSIILNIFLYFSIFILFFLMFCQKKGYTMIATFISLAIYYITFVISVSISYVFFWILNIRNTIVISLCIIIVLQIILLKLFFKIRRFKNGFSFLKVIYENENIDLTLFAVSCIIVYLYSLLGYNNHSISSLDQLTAYQFFTFFIFGIIMIIVIQETLVLSYKQKILKNTISDYENQLKEKDNKIQKLSDEKYKISKLNHEFYNRQKALMLKVETALENMNFEVGEEIDLKDKIKALSDEYSCKAKKNKLESNLPKTDIEEIDDMFTYMNSECKNNGIEFILQVNGNINHLVNKYIEKSKLVTLIGDHLRDAIIAVNYSENKYKSILAILGIKGDNYEFCIYDSGIEFEIETFDKLGLESATTHKDNNGTGIGFITTFETLKETKASFVLEELNELKENNYTKALKFIFDNKSRLEIISYRSDELRNKLRLNRFKIIKSGK